MKFEIHSEVFNEFGDEILVNRCFTADRISRVLTMTDYDADGIESVIVLDGKKISTLLRWAVHSLEIFMWAEDYDLNPSRNSIPPYFDLLPEFWRDDEDDEVERDDEERSKNDAPGEEISWRVQIKYADRTEQNFTYSLINGAAPKSILFADYLGATIAVMLKYIKTNYTC